MHPSDGLGKKRRGGQDRHLALPERWIEPEGGNGIGNHKTVKGRVRDHLGRAWHEEPVRGDRENAPCAAVAAGTGRAQHRAAGADEIVENDDRPIPDVAGEPLAADHARAAAFFHEGTAAGR